jgi:hypothetical protein
VDFNNYDDISEVIVEVTWDMDNLLIYNDNGTPGFLWNNFKIKM